MGEHALAIPFEGLGIEKVGVANDLPLHVTVLIPCPDDVPAITEVLAPFDQFEVTFGRLDRFPGTLWLAPDPEEPFVALTEAMIARFPDWKPYRGVFKSIVPHLTIAQDRLDDVAELVEPLLPLQSRVESVVLYEHAYGGHWHELATFDL
jgi:2'-5' RNA ligase